MPTGRQTRVFILAWITYFAFYVSREPYSLVKSTLLRSWYPFNGRDGWLLLGILDTVGLTAYAIGIFVVGYLCEKFDSLYILVLGCFVSGVTTILYGCADYWNIHEIWYFVVLRVLNGLGEAGGWPTLIKMLDHNFNMEEKREIILTGFASCKFFGIIVGCIISSFSLTFENWGDCFIYCGLVVLVMGIVDILFLPNLPPDADNRDRYCQCSETPPRTPAHNKDNITDPASAAADDPESSASKKQIFWMALALPGVAEYAVQLFFVKLSVYIVYYWLPTWLTVVTVGGSVITYAQSCWYTALWGFGGVIGTFLIGYLTYIGKLYGLTSTAFCAIAGTFILWLYYYSTGEYVWLFLCILFGVGVYQNGPYSLSSACMPMVLNLLNTEVNSGARLVGMATGIIDGFGSVGAIFGPLSASIILQYSGQGWGLVFLVVAIAMFIAAITLLRQVYIELSKTFSLMAYNRL